MNSSDEFTSPIATSTVWKKKKPHGWQQEPNTTFHDLQDFVAESPNEKENIQSKNVDVKDTPVDVMASSETTLNLWKYIVPPHPGELEEDSFIGDNMEFNLDGSTPIDVEKGKLSESISEDLANLEIRVKELCVLEPEDKENENPSRQSEDFSPIPGYIITGSNVIMRRHSAQNEERVVKKTDEGEYIRKILSAPPSMAILDEPISADINELDAEVAALTSISKLEKDADDIFAQIEEEEDLAKYFEDGSDILLPEDTTEMDEKVIEAAEEVVSDIEKLVEPGAVSDSPIPDANDYGTTDGDNENSPLKEEDIAEVDLSERIDASGEGLQNEQDLEVSDNIPSYEGNLSPENTDAVPEIVGTENIFSDEENIGPEKSYCEEASLEVDGALSDEDNVENVKIAANVTPEIKQHRVDRHPSFNSSPEIHHHSILDRILKDDFVSGKQIIIPPTFTVEQPCAVGIIRKILVMIENKTDLWVQCNISVDEEGRMSGFSSQNRLIIPPLAEETLPVCLSAKQDGLCLGTVELTVNSVISGMLPEESHCCKITAIAELPGLSLLPKEIKFGIQVENKEATYELKNSSDYELPLKVVLHSEGLDEVFSLSDPMSKYPTAVYALVLPPQQSFIGHIEFCPYEQYTACEASLRVYVDSPNGAMLAQTDVLGTVGHYKLRIPTDKHSLAFHSSPGEPVSTDISLLNTGNMDTTVALKVTRPFTVTPPFISSLVPGEEATCQVSYFPVVTEHVTGLLTLSLAGDAVVYQVPTEGRSTKNKPKVATNTAPYTLLANKSIVNFGGSEIGRQKEDTILLQNDSPTQLMCLVIRVISPSRSFYILNDSSITLSCDIVLPAGSSQTLKLGYTPLHSEQHVGELLVKSKNKDISFNIPLSGHGGLSQVSVLNAQQTSSRLWVDMGDITPNTRNTARITLHNTGSRAAFVSGVLEDEEGYPIPSNLAWINPTACVIPDNASRELYVIYEAGAGKEGGASVNRIALLKLFCGDEIARRRFCKVLKILDRPVQDQDLPFDPTVEYLTPGDMKREGEVKVPHVNQGDMVFERQLFGSGLSQLFISVMGRKEAPGRKSLVALSRHEVAARSRSSTSASTLSAGNMSQDLPADSYRVNTAPIPHAKSPKVSPKKLNKEEPSLWSFSVDELTFNKPTVFHVVNESHESLLYEVSYEGTLYDLTPKAGCIPPLGCTEISIRPRVTHSPFISTLLVTAGGSEKTLKLAFNPLQPDKPGNARSSCLASSSGDENKPLIVQSNVSFQKIPVNTSCSAFLEFTNTHNSVIQWRLSSAAPAYRKVESSAPIRVPYSAFCVDMVSGVTPKGSRERIPITFYPKHIGDFTQCWDFVYCGRSIKSLKHSNRVIFEGSAASSSARSASVLSSRSKSSSTSNRPKDRVFIKITSLEFSAAINTCQSLSFKVGNPLKVASKVVLSTLLPPFYLKYKEVLVEAGHSARIPIKYKPTMYGEFREVLQIETEQEILTLELNGTVCDPRKS